MAGREPSRRPGEPAARRRGGLQLHKILDLEFLKSVPAILLAIQAICCLLGLILAGSWQGSYTGSHVFFLLVITPAFFVSLSLLVTRTIGLDELIQQKIPWDLILAGHHVLGTVLLLISSCLMVETAQASSLLKAAGVFGLFAWNSALVGSVLYGRVVYTTLRGGPACHTATITPGRADGGDVEAQPEDIYSDEDEEFSSDEDAIKGDMGGGVTFVGQTARVTSSYSEVYAAPSEAPGSPATPGSPARGKRMSAVYDPNTGTWAPQ